MRMFQSHPGLPPVVKKFVDVEDKRTPLNLSELQEVKRGLYNYIKEMTRAGQDQNFDKLKMDIKAYKRNIFLNLMLNYKKTALLVYVIAFSALITGAYKDSDNGDYTSEQKMNVSDQMIDLLLIAFISLPVVAALYNVFTLWEGVSLEIELDWYRAALSEEAVGIVPQCIVDFVDGNDGSRDAAFEAINTSAEPYLQRYLDDLRQCTDVGANKEIMKRVIQERLDELAFSPAALPGA